jgi:general secretion pathway protein H
MRALARVLRGPFARGFSIAELLVVMALLGLAVAVAVPLVSRQLERASIRSAADRFASDLRAVRMIAVSTRRTQVVQLDSVPGAGYSVPDARGGPPRRVALPHGIQIVAGPAAIAFRPDGSVSGGAETIFEAAWPGGPRERWTVRTSVLGLSRTEHADAP